MRNVKSSFLAATMALALVIGCGLAGCSKADYASGNDATSYQESRDSAAAKAEYSSPLHDAARETGAGRSTVRSGQVGITVDDVNKSDQAITDVVKGVRGYVANEVGRDLASDHPSIELTMRVPEESFESVMSTISKLGRVIRKQVAAADVTEDILSLDAQMAKLKERKNPNPAEMSTLVQQQNAYREQARMSTIELQIEQNPDAARAAAANTSWSKDSLNAALSAAGNVFRTLGAGAIWLAAFAPIWGAAILVIWLAKRQQSRKAAQS